MFSAQSALGRRCLTWFPTLLLLLPCISFCAIFPMSLILPQQRLEIVTQAAITGDDESNVVLEISRTAFGDEIWQ